MHLPVSSSALSYFGSRKRTPTTVYRVSCMSIEFGGGGTTITVSQWLLVESISGTWFRRLVAERCTSYSYSKIQHREKFSAVHSSSTCQTSPRKRTASLRHHVPDPCWPSYHSRFLLAPKPGMCGAKSPLPRISSLCRAEVSTRTTSNIFCTAINEVPSIARLNRCSLALSHSFTSYTMIIRCNSNNPGRSAH